MLATIDIGTNTINLLIAEASETGFQTVLFERIPARLGKGGMKEGILTEEAMMRGLDALQGHKDNCDTHGVSAIKVTATSAVRSASNGADFVNRVKEELGLEIEVIDGEREAELIWKGVRLTGLLDREVGLIMDIGGGSTEFILADAEQVHWKKSYDLGVTRLAERFQAPDPFTDVAEQEMNEALTEELEELWSAMRAVPCQRLIGASGSFNSISTMLVGGDLDKVLPIHQAIDLQAYTSLSLTLRRSGFHQRYAIPGLVPDRVDTIPYSVLLIDAVLGSQPQWTMERSSYALKEGVMAEMMAQS
jgi:exopolyphosphatase / guanosine-5'-triphosphate,3'-diphosphate pyrophosphatase